MGEYSECVHKRSFGLTDSDVISRHSLKVAGSRDRLDRDSGIGPGLPTESTPGSLTPKIPKVLFENNYTTVELNISVTIQLRANLKVPA